MPEDHPSPWSRPGPTGPAPAWTPAGSYAPALPAAVPYATAPAPVVPQAGAGYGAPPVQVHLTTPAAPGRGLAVVGVVLAGLALVVALVALGVGSLSAFGDPGGGYGPMRGTLAAPAGRALTGPALADEIATKVSEDGGDPEGITCPATARIGQDVTTVCHGFDFGEITTFVVFFEDDRGAYTLLEI